MEIKPSFLHLFLQPRDPKTHYFMFFNYKLYIMYCIYYMLYIFILYILYYMLYIIYYILYIIYYLLCIIYNILYIIYNILYIIYYISYIIYFSTFLSPFLGDFWTSDVSYTPWTPNIILFEPLIVIFNHLGGFGLVFRFLKNEPFLSGGIFPFPTLLTRYRQSEFARFFELCFGHSKWPQTNYNPI